MGNIKVFNEPMYIARGEYESALDRYMNTVRRVPGVLAGFTMGSVGAPGLSDLDVVIVVEDDFMELKSDSLSTCGFDDRLFLHGPVVIPESMVTNVQDLLYASNSTRVFGSIRIPDISEMDSDRLRSLSKMYLIDFIESRLFQRALVTHWVDKRAWLTRIWSVTHSCEMYAQGFGVQLSDEERVWLDRIKETRRRWNNEGEVPDSLFFAAFNAAEKLNERLFLNGLRMEYGDCVLVRDFVIATTKAKLTMSSRFDQPYYSVRMISLGSRTLPVVSGRLPAAYACHICGYRPELQAAGRVRAMGNRSLMRSQMYERAEIVGRHKRWLRAHAPFSGSMSGYLGAGDRGVAGVKEFVKTLLVRVFG